MDTISLSRTVLEIMLVKILKGKQNGGFWPFKGQGQFSIFFYHGKGTSSHQTTSFEILRIKIGLAIQLYPCQRAWKVIKKKEIIKKKKHKTLYVAYMYLSPWKFSRYQILLDYLGRWRNQSCQIFFQSVHSGVSGKGSNFAIFSANRRWPLQLLLLYYRTTVIFMIHEKIGSQTNRHTDIKAVFWIFAIF